MRMLGNLSINVSFALLIVFNVATCSWADARPENATSISINSDSQVDLDQIESVTILGDNIFNYIDNLDLTPSSYLSSLSSNFTLWSVTIRKTPLVRKQISIRQTIHLLSQTPLIDVDDLQIIMDNNEERKVTVKFDVNIEKSVLPQDRYRKYESNNFTSKPFDVTCNFIGGGIQFNITQENISSTITDINSEGPIIFGIQNRMLMINIPDAIASNFVSLGKYLMTTNQTDPLLIDSLHFEDIFLSCNKNPQQTIEVINISCYLIARESVVGRIIAFDLHYESSQLTIKYLLSFNANCSKDNVNTNEFTFNLKNFQIYNNKLIVGIQNYGVGIYSFYPYLSQTSSDSRSSNTSIESDIFTICNIKSETHFITSEKHYNIKFLQDLDVYRSSIYLITTSGFSIIDLNTYNFLENVISHPRFRRISQYARMIDVNVPTLFIGIEVDNDPIQNLPEFFVELVIRDNLLYPTINKIFMSSQKILYDGIQSSNTGLTSLLDTIGRRILVFQRGVPNTVNMPIYQISVIKELEGSKSSNIIPIILPDSNMKDAFLLTTSISSYVIYNLNALSFDYSCTFAKAYEYVLNLSTFTMCGKNFDNPCKVESVTMLEVDQILKSNNTPVIIAMSVTVFILLLLIIIFIFYKKGLIFKRRHTSPNRVLSKHSFELKEHQSYVQVQAETPKSKTNDISACT